MQAKKHGECNPRAETHPATLEADLALLLVHQNLQLDQIMCALTYQGLSLVNAQWLLSAVGRFWKGGVLSDRSVSPVSKRGLVLGEGSGEGAERALQPCNCGAGRASWGSSPLTSYPVVVCSALWALVPSFSGPLSRSVAVTHCSEVISKTISPLFRVSSSQVG